MEQHQSRANNVELTDEMRQKHAQCCSAWDGNAGGKRRVPTLFTMEGTRSPLFCSLIICL